MFRSGHTVTEEQEIDTGNGTNGPVEGAAPHTQIFFAQDGQPVVGIATRAEDEENRWTILEWGDWQTELGKRVERARTGGGRERGAFIRQTAMLRCECVVLLARVVVFWSSTTGTDDRVPSRNSYLRRYMILGSMMDPGRLHLVHRVTRVTGAAWHGRRGTEYMDGDDGWIRHIFL